MKFGRDFTNTFVFDKLSLDEQQKVLDGTYDLSSMNAVGIMKFKEDVVGQIKLIKKFEFHHLELDCDVPNPYPAFSFERNQEIKAFAEENGISLSVHLTYSNAGSSVCSLQELDRQAAVEIQKKYIQFATDIGAKYVIMHPGSVPFYMCSELFLKKLKEQLVKSVVELAKYSTERNIKFHLENNTAFDNVFYEPEDCIEIVNIVRSKGAEVYFNFDIGHWFTRADKGKPLPDGPIEVMKKIPKELVCELHVNDYIPEKIIFHPPLNQTEGPLKGENFRRYAELMKKLNPEVLVLETAFKTLEQVKNREKIIQEETKYIEEVFTG
ncbi:MAG: sugar phosphate isomerase/epimerase family protein [Elusimicrobiota bacterium]|nr:sugar phosphate isomerase/epimerase family protein [Elusimicrobiota bacterium]